MKDVLRNRIFLVTFVLFLCFSFTAFSLEKKMLFREDFQSLDKWRPLYFPKIKSHTSYTLESQGNDIYLRTESNSSASALVYKEEFPVHDYPKARWRWKVDNIYQKGDPQKKSGDDYPLRVYFMFKYDPENASFTEKIKYGLAKKLYGEYPPHRSLNYVWSSKEHVPASFESPYTDKVRIIVLQKGDRNIGKWIVEEVDVLKDYQKAFGVNPPFTVSIAIMNDSDNTESKAVSYIDFIEVYGNAQ